MKIVKNKIQVAELWEMSKKMLPELVKATVDIEKEIMAVDAPMHSDLFEFLMKEENSEPKNLWGINIYPDIINDERIEFDSMMNIRPNLGNRSRYVESEEMRNKIISIVKKLVI